MRQMVAPRMKVSTEADSRGMLASCECWCSACSNPHQGERAKRSEKVVVATRVPLCCGSADV